MVKSFITGTAQAYQLGQAGDEHHEGPSRSACREAGRGDGAQGVRQAGEPEEPARQDRLIAASSSTGPARGAGQRQFERIPTLQVLVRDNNVDQALRVLKKRMQREGIFRISAAPTRSPPSARPARRPRRSGGRARRRARRSAQGLLPMPKRKIDEARGRGRPGGFGGGAGAGGGPRPGGFGGGGGAAAGAGGPR